MDIYASDEEKAEEIKRWWRENGRTVIVGLMIGFTLIFAVRYWMNYQHNQTVQASLVYQQVMSSLSEGNSEQALSSTQGLIKAYPKSGYAVFAALKMSSSVGEAESEELLNWIMANAELVPHRELAKLRLARLKASQNNYQEALTLIQSSEVLAYQSLFAELEGDIYKAQSETAQALAAYQRAIVSLETGDARQSILKIKIDDVAVANAS